MDLPEDSERFGWTGALSPICGTGDTSLALGDFHYSQRATVSEKLGTNGVASCDREREQDLASQQVSASPPMPTPNILRRAVGTKAP